MNNNKFNFLQWDACARERQRKEMNNTLLDHVYVCCNAFSLDLKG